MAAIVEAPQFDFGSSDVIVDIYPNAIKPLLLIFAKCWESFIVY